MRIYPTIEPNAHVAHLNVGEYLDRHIVKYPLPNNGKFSYSDDPSEERFQRELAMTAKKIQEVHNGWRSILGTKIDVKQIPERHIITVRIA